MTEEALAAPIPQTPRLKRIADSLPLPILSEATTFETAATMTVVLLLFYTEGNWYVRIPVILIAVTGLLHRPLLANNNFWFAVAVFSAGAIYQNWYKIDNHKWLICYWCIALSAAAATDDARDTLRRNARWLIGLAFVFATVWKLMSKDFLDGTFFYFSVLTESRLETLTRLIAGTPASAFTDAAEALKKLRHVEGVTVATAALYNSARLAWFAKAMTWWTLLIESAIAIAFLAPRRFVLSKVRDGFLLIFLITTYTSATVVGFGWVLAIMGFAQCSGEAQWRRRLYILAFVLIFLYTGPWSDFISGLLSKVTGTQAAVSP